MRVLEEPTQLVGVAHDVDRANAAVGDVERVGAVAGDRMTQEQTGRAVDRDELEVRLRPVLRFGHERLADANGARRSRSVAGGELDLIQFLLARVSAQTMDRYLGCKQKLRCAANDRMGIEPDAARPGRWPGRMLQSALGELCEVIATDQFGSEACRRWGQSQSEMC
jgi:hypothetical protein